MYPRISLHDKIAFSAISTVLIGFALVVEGASPYLEFINWQWTAELGGLLILTGFFFAFLANSVGNRGWLADQVLRKYYTVRWDLPKFPIQHRILAYGGLGLLLVLVSSVIFPGVFASELDSPEHHPF